MQAVNLIKSNVDLFKYKLTRKSTVNTFTYTLRAGELFSVQSK